MLFGGLLVTERVSSIPVIQDKELWQTVRHMGDPVIIFAIVAITIMIGRVMTVEGRRWLPLVVLGLGGLGAFAVQLASPNEIKQAVMVYRIIVYAGGASLAYGLRKLFLPKIVLDALEGKNNGG